MLRDYTYKFFGIIKENGVRATLNFLFIFAFINAFIAVFGSENTIVGVAVIIIMLSSMVRDMTAAPVKHFLHQAGVMLLIVLSSCLVNLLPPAPVFFLNLLTVFIIIYAFTYEYASHMYFPYILSYLFLVYISPVSADQLPKRIAAVLAGSACIILYQLYKGRRRVMETAQSVLCAMIDQAGQSIRFLASGEGEPACAHQVRALLCRLSRIVFERRKRALCISDASFALVDVGRGLENLILLLNDLAAHQDLQREPGQNPRRFPGQLLLLERISIELEGYRRFLLRETQSLPPLNRRDLIFPGEEPEERLYSALDYLRSHLLHMTDPEKKTLYRKTGLSMRIRIQAALDVSAVRVVYAIRVSVVLSLFFLAVQALDLPHGKWLMFTLASLSMPYADDVGKKTGQRVTATFIGGLASLVIYSLVPSVPGRSAVMIFFGYFSGYFSGYTSVYACSTISALGGAVLAGYAGWEQVGLMCLIRLAYICLGSAIALVANCVLLPFRRSRATELLMKKYSKTTSLLTRVCREENLDPQLYYNLVIQAHLQEEKLLQNAPEADRKGMRDLLEVCRRHVRDAHRHRPFPCSPAAAG